MSEAGPRAGRRGQRRGAGQSVFSKAQAEAARALYHCNYCHRDISDNIRVKCAVCADFDLCVECFSVGVEVMGHSNTHSYKVMDNLSFPIFHPNWGSDEELLLLEAVEIYGPGNWAAVSEHVGTKSTKECMQHYYQIYIEPDSFPLPTPAPEMAGLDVWKLAELAKSSCGRKRMRLDTAAAQQQLKHLLQQDEAAPEQPQDSAQQQQQPDGVQIKQEQQQDAQGAVPSAEAAAGADVKMEDAAAVPQQQQQQQQDVKPPPDGAQADAASPGSAPGHGKVSFRQRAAEEAAAVAAAGSTAVQQQPVHATTGGLGKIHPYSSPQQQQQPAAEGTAGAEQPQQQQQPLPEGAEAAVAAAGASGRSLGPSAVAAAAAGDTPRVKGSGPQLDMMTGWHPKRFEFEPEWDNDAEAAIAEIEFKETDTPEEEAAKLRLLEIYNKRLDERARRQAFILEHGLLRVRRMQGTEKRRLPGEKEKHAQMRCFARYQPPGSHEGMVEGLLLEGRLRLRIAELQAHRAAGRRTLADVEEAEQLEAAAKKKAKEKQLREAGAAGLAAQEADGVGPGGSQGPATLGGYRSTASALSVYRQRQGVALDISGLPGADKLTVREAELCSSARLLPVHYLSLKDVMMRDAQVHGHISRHDARGFFRLESARSARIWEVLCASGWLKDNNPEEAEDKRRTYRAKKEALVQQQNMQNMQQAAAASLAIGFPPSSGAAKAVSAAAAAAAAAAVLGLPVPSGVTGVSESGGGEGGLVSEEATGTTASGVAAEDMDDDDDDFKP